MESLIAGLGVAAGAGWGVAAGLAVALWVALRHIVRAPTPTEAAIHVLQPQAEHDYSGFGNRRTGT